MYVYMHFAYTSYACTQVCVFFRCTLTHCQFHELAT